MSEAGRMWTDERLADIKRVLYTDNGVWRVPVGDLVTIAEDLDDFLDYAIARLEAAERVVEAARERDAADDRHHALEFDYGTWHPDVMSARDDRDEARKRYRDALAAYATESEARP